MSHPLISCEFLDAAVCDDVHKRVKLKSDDSFSPCFNFLELFSTLTDLHMTFTQH